MNAVLPCVLAALLACATAQATELKLAPGQLAAIGVGEEIKVVCLKGPSFCTIDKRGKSYKLTQDEMILFENAGLEKVKEEFRRLQASHKCPAYAE